MTPALTASPYLDVYRARHGRAHKITREQLRDLLIAMHEEAGLNLREYSGWFGADENASIPEIARCVANAPKRITMLSLGGHVRDIQYDQPGSMNPSQHAQISCCAADIGGNATSYLRRHAKRLVLITGDLLQIPSPPPAADTLTGMPSSSNWPDQKTEAAIPRRRIAEYSKRWTFSTPSRNALMRAKRTLA